MAKTLKKWQGWLIFGGAMVIVFVLGLLCSSMLERRAEVVSIFNNRQTKMTDSIVSQNEKFAQDFPREYETWSMTEDTTFKSKYNSSQEQDVLAERPEMVILWAGYSFSRGIIHHVDTVIVLMTYVRLCVQEVQVLMDKMTYSQEPVGPARVLMFHV